MMRGRLLDGFSRLVEVIKDINGRFDDYNSFLFKMSYYQLSRDRILREAKDRYHSGDGKKRLLNFIEIIKTF